ncbi:MAG: cell division protein FtsB [Burkholderiaceae bacterium]|nr:MAG: cell division protein FtsB [Burkholderiaceae bacterium]
MRLLTISLVVLLALIQYPLWLGKGGWLRVNELDRKLTAQQTLNAELKTRNASLEAEVKDLKNGTEAIEERARYELGMVKKDEVFVQVVPKR